MILITCLIEALLNITLFMLIHVKEETLRVIFQPSFSKLGKFRGQVIESYVLQKWVVQGPLCFAILEL